MTDQIPLPMTEQEVIEWCSDAEKRLVEAERAYQAAVEEKLAATRARMAIRAGGQVFKGQLVIT